MGLGVDSLPSSGSLGDKMCVLGGLDTLGAFLGLEEEFLGFRRGREPHAQVTGLGCHIAIDGQVELEIGESHRARLATFSAGKVWVFPGAQSLPGLLNSGPGCG